MNSRVEEQFLSRTGQKRRYEGDEHLGVLVVETFPHLGTLTAARFLEWVQGNPGGVVALPTGRTPQYFIEEVRRFLRTWNTAETGAELERWGVDPALRPDPGSLRFVQIDEFYPINPRHTNSFHHYVEKYYLEGFGMNPERALLIDCERIGLPQDVSLEDVWGDEGVDLSLRYRHPHTRLERLQKNVLHRVDEWCSGYEERIREMGGIGFFLGGIGPDGHIAFNVQGSDFFSTTRLCPVNYETQAASASDLGGIEVAKKRLVITIGLATITRNPDCVAIVMAAGEAKAQIVADSIERRKNILYPATALQDLPNACFYLTRGAAKRLRGRMLAAFRNEETAGEERIEQIVIDLALEHGKPVEALTGEDYRSGPFGRELARPDRAAGRGTERPGRELAPPEDRPRDGDPPGPALSSHRASPRRRHAGVSSLRGPAHPGAQQSP